MKLSLVGYIALATFLLLLVQNLVLLALVARVPTLVPAWLRSPTALAERAERELPRLSPIVAAALEHIAPRVVFVPLHRGSGTSIDGEVDARSRRGRGAVEARARLTG